MSTPDNNKDSNSMNKRDPYSVLNLSKHAADVDIQRAYRRGSRALHPDKQALSDANAGNAFVTLKDSYDILSDPTLRQAFDFYGHFGVEFVRKSLLRSASNNTHPSLYHILSSLHSAGKSDEALQVLQEALEYDQYQRYFQAYPTQASVELACTSTSTMFLFNNNNYNNRSHLPILEAQNIAMAFDTTLLSSSRHPQQSSTASDTATNRRWSVELAGNSSVSNEGEGSSRGALRLECYEVQPETDVAVEVASSSGTDSYPTLAVTSTRVLTSGTSLKIGAQIDAPIYKNKKSSNPLALTASTQRLLWNNSVSGSLSMGMGMPSRRLHYISCIFTTLKWSLARVRTSLNLGLNQYPLKVTLEPNNKTNSSSTNNSHVRSSASIEINPISGHWKFKAISFRKKSKFMNVGIGLSDATIDGLSLLVVIERGDNMTFKIPILIMANNNTLYYQHVPSPVKILCVGIMLFLMDAGCGCILDKRNNTFFISSSTTASTSSRRAKGNNVEKIQNVPLAEESTLCFMRQELKKRKDSELQLQLIKKSADKKKCLEESKNGLVIITATYYTETAQSLDVTSQLQFWVTKSKLFLPGGYSKAKLIGFYDLVMDGNHSILKKEQTTSLLWNRFLSFIFRRRSQRQHEERSIAVKLYVRYKVGFSLYEITVNDKDSLILPNERALRIGDCKLVK